MKTILYQSDIDRMRESITPKPLDFSKTEKKNHLKKLSEDKLKNWPNTLEALRIKKESFTKDREAEAEAKRQEIDREEAEMRRKARLDSIRKANDLIYAQTDKMKMLKGQILYADVIATRYQQIEYKNSIKEQEKEREAAYHEHILKEVQRLEAIEQSKLEKTKNLVDKVKVARLEQLDEVRKQKETLKQKEIDEGIAMKLAAQKLLDDELKDFERKKKISTESNFRMLKANADLKLVREQIEQKEREAEAFRDSQVDGIEFKKLEIKRLTKERFEKSQLTRQKLIDAAVEQLKLKSGKENAILDKQIKDQKDKEDRNIAAKNAKIEADYAFTVESRTEQVRAKKEKLDKQKQEDDLLVAKWKKENEDGIKVEANKIINARKATIVNKTEQKYVADKRKAKEEEDRLRDIEQTRFLQSIDTNDESRFVEICQAEIARNIKLGKPVYTLLRALEYRAPKLLPAKAN